MNYLLDTNICIYFLKGRYGLVVVFSCSRRTFFTPGVVPNAKMTDKKTYLVIPNKGEIQLKCLLEHVGWVRQDKYELRNWFPRNALIEKNSGSSRVFTGQSFDDKHFE